MKIYLLLFRDIIGFLRWRFPALLVLMALVASTEGLSVTLLLPLLSQVGISYAVGQGAASAVLSRYLTTLGTTIGSLGLLGVVIAVAAIRRYYRSHCNGKWRERPAAIRDSDSRNYLLR